MNLLLSRGGSARSLALDLFNSCSSRDSGAFRSVCSSLTRVFAASDVLSIRKRRGASLIPDPHRPSPSRSTAAVRLCVCVSEGSPFSWWLGGPGAGRLRSYWGGAQPGSRQCACGLQGDCVDPQHYCNCDADRTEW